ncbi:hypothetical protein ACJDT4_21140 [Clostridium neuense]|uniref:Uncharacterized protein n=1 Tax=Clostridium neuense TaxID=1728934 RepID=A0ABW8TKY3_9CLOT
MIENEMYAIYKGKECKCDIEDENTISIYSSSLDDGFSDFMGVYYMDVSFKDCTRVYKKTLCFKYNNDSFLIREEHDNKVLLETGSRSYDLISLGFKRVLNDIFQKWVSLSEGKRYWAIYDYK